MVTTVFGAGRTRKSDEDQLAFATSHTWVVYSFNIRDFYRIHTLWRRTERTLASFWRHKSGFRLANRRAESC